MASAELAGKTPNPSSDRWLSPTIVHFISGGIAGCLAKTFIAPFDRVKILSQVWTQGQPRPHEFTTQSLASTAEIRLSHTLQGIFSTLRTIYQKEGATKLWLGNGATVIRIAPYAAIQFMVYEKAKQIIITEEKKTSNWMPLLHMICGSIAGTVSTAATYPLDLLRARLASQVKERRYRHTFHGMAIMCREEGIRSLWKGMVPTLQGIIPYAGVNFAVFETLKPHCPQNEKGEISPMYKLACGGIAGAVGQTVSYPWDVVRRRRQTAGFAAGVPEFEYKGSWRTMVSIARTEGISALYRGISINFWKVTPAVSISFTVYDYLKSWLSRV